MKRMLLLLLAAVGMLCGCKPEARRQVFTIAYAPNESTEQNLDARKGLAGALSQALGQEVREIHASDYTAIIEALRTGQADMAYIGSLAIGMAMRRAKATPVVMKAPEGDKTQAFYHSLLVARADNAKLTSIADIRGKTMAFVDPDSTSGNLVPTYEIIQAFPGESLTGERLHTNGRFFEAVSYAGRHQAALRAVAKGDVDLAACSDNILAFEEARGEIAPGTLKVIHTSAPIPAEGVVLARSVPEAVRERVAAFLVAYDDEAYFRDVLKVPNARFVPCSSADYAPILALYDAINED
ncbi:MAG: phosphate/phosphite/phosphonate ABC transporter substrate-binding protein [Candidatus Spyradenecus sp.]